MTIEELKKEAEKKYCNGCKWRIEQCLWAWRKTNGLKEPNEKNCSCKEVPAYLAGAEPREKQIAELEKENAELKKDNEGYDKDNTRLVQQYNDLQKENAELKGLKDVATLIRANNDTVVTLMQLNNMLVSKSQQLTKAKEIIKRFSEFANLEVEYDPEHPQEHTDLWNELCKEAEQFLNREVEK